MFVVLARLVQQEANRRREKEEKDEEEVEERKKRGSQGTEVALGKEETINVYEAVNHVRQYLPYAVTQVVSIS